MWQGQRILAVVPARGGSKGIPGKNLRSVAGLSLIGWAAAVAKALPWIDRAVLSTDDAEIAAEGRRCGLDLPFMRPPELASDTATGAAAWAHAWRATEAADASRYECSILLQPTAPLRRPSDVERTLRAMIEGGHRAATTVSEVPGHFTPQKMLTRDPGGILHFVHPDGARHSNRQGIPTYWYRNGLCYAVRRSALLDHGEIVERDCIGVPVEGPVANIDEPFDLELAEFLAARHGWKPGQG